MKGAITKCYGEKCVFNRFAFDFADGEITCIVGESGVGKTTLLKAIAGLISVEGEIERRQSAFVFQEHRLLTHLTAKENLLYVGGTEEGANTALEKCRLQGKENRLVSTLSGGEKQRVALARAFVSKTDLWLMDEPFSALDTPLKIALWKDFISLWQEKKPTVLLVTHDLEEAWALGHRVILLKDGKIAYDCNTNHTQFPAPYGQSSEEKQDFFRAVIGE